MFFPSTEQQAIVIMIKNILEVLFFPNAWTSHNEYIVPSYFFFSKDPEDFF